MPQHGRTSSSASSSSTCSAAGAACASRLSSSARSSSSVRRCSCTVNGSASGAAGGRLLLCRACAVHVPHASAGAPCAHLCAAGLLHAEEQLCRTSPQHLSDSLTKPYFVCVKLHRAKFALQTWTLARTYPGKALARAQPDAQRSPAREGEKESAGLPGEWPWSPSPRRSARPQRKQRRVRSSAALRELRGSRWRTAPTATPQRQGPMQLARRLRTLATAPTRPSAQ